MILRSDKANKQQGRKIFVLLGHEQSGHYIKYEHEVDVNRIGSRKCGCHFKLRGRPVSNEEGWVLKVIYGLRIHALYEILVGHLYVKRLKSDEHALLVDC